MEEIKINQYYDKKYDVSTNLLYEDVWDDVFGVDDWVEDIGDAVGFIDHNPVHSTIVGENVMKFYPYERGNDAFSYMHKLADTILRSLEFCMARVFHGFEEPSSIHEIPNSKYELCLRDDSGIAVKIHFDDFAVYLSFFEK